VSAMVERPLIAERTIEFSLQVIQLCRRLERDDIGKTLGRQLLRSGTSIGANVHEAQGGQSKADFICKMSIAHKEALETMYWLRLMEQANLVPQEHVAKLMSETEELVRILSRILITSKSRKGRVV
jgi:four helix bundle protein